MSDFQVWTLTVMVICLYGLWTVYRIARFAIDRSLPQRPEQYERSQ